MHGLVSLLDEKHTQKTKEIWQTLKEKCRFGGIDSTPFPHFSWLIAEDFNWPALKKCMEEIAAETHPFTVQTNGLGIFSGYLPVIYIPLVRTEALSKLHRLIWESTQEIRTNIVSYYAPENWTPHITLAYEDIKRGNISCAMQKLAFQNFKWKFEVDNLSFIQQEDDVIGQMQSKFKFKGSK